MEDVRMQPDLVKLIAELLVAEPLVPARTHQQQACIVTCQATVFAFLDRVVCVRRWHHLACLQRRPGCLEPVLVLTQSCSRMLCRNVLQSQAGSSAGRAAYGRGRKNMASSNSPNWCGGSCNFYVVILHQSQLAGEVLPHKNCVSNRRPVFWQV